jgi:hypothetical protein
MSRSLLNRLRLATLLLAFGLGLVGGVASDAAMASQMAGIGQSGLSADHPCPMCPDAQSGAMMPGCTTAACWTIPALPVQTTVVQPRPAAAHPEPAEPRIAGIVFSPDPHPPRALPHS